MTLNILGTSRHAVYVTGDFRMTTRNRPDADNLNVQKLIPVVKLGWCGIVAFSGVGRTSSGLDVGGWIVDQVRDEHPDEHIAHFLERLKSADRWLARLPEKERYLSIVMAGFRQRHPFSLVVSNCDDVNGKPLSAVAPQLEVHWRKPKKPEVRVFGSGASSVTLDDRERLRLLLAKHAPNDTIEELARANVAAAGRTSTVSPQCVVGSMNAAGNGEISPKNVDFAGGYFPDFIKKQLEAGGVIGHETKLDDEGRPLLKAWKGMHIVRRGVVGRGAVAVVGHRFLNAGKPIMKAGSVE